MELRTTRTALGFLATAATVVALALAAPAADAAPSLTVERFAGESRYLTAVNASAETFAPGTDRTVVLASGDSTIDALSAAYLAGTYGSPVLLTAQDHLTSETITELRRLGATRVVIAGGLQSVDAYVEAILRRSFTVERAEGADRYETAVRLVDLAPATAPDPEVVFVAGGSGAADAASVSPLASANGWPVLLTRADSIPFATASALRDFPDAEVVVLGGTNVVSDAVYRELGASGRLAGEDRYETSVAVAEFAHDDGGFDAESFGVAVGTSATTGGLERNHQLVDALVAGPVLARRRAPLLLTENPVRLGERVRAYLVDNAAGFTGTMVVFGGYSAVSPVVVEDATAAVGAPAPPRPTPTGPVNGPTQELPVAPTDLVVVERTDVDTRFAWTSSRVVEGSAPTNSYHLEVTDTAGAVLASTDVGAGRELRGFFDTPGAVPTTGPLTLSVRAQNVRGFGPATTTTIDPLLRPPAVPTSAAASGGVETVDVSWTGSATVGTGRAAVSAYDVTLSRVQDPSSNEVRYHHSASASATSHRFTRIPAGDYVVTVAAASTASGSSSPVPAGTVTVAAR